MSETKLPPLDKEYEAECARYDYIPAANLCAMALKSRERQLTAALEREEKLKERCDKRFNQLAEMATRDELKERELEYLQAKLAALQGRAAKDYKDTHQCDCDFIDGCENR